MTEPGIPAGESEPSGGSTTRHSIIHRIVGGALEQPFIILTVAIVLAGVGVWSFSRLPVDA